ncbi:MAG: molecular chaperone TorD family protein [Nitrospinae bacterium]|nr:molecular chaperone TorD family protein [Nitrospinota bacterium]
MSGFLKSIGVDLAPGAGESDDTLLDELAAEYCALFVQPGSAQPYESVYLEGRHLAPAADKVEITYQKSGFEYRKSYPNIFPDHAGIELAFIASLLDARIKNIKEGVLTDEDGYEMERMSFISAHPAKWMRDYFLKVSAQAKLKFYSAILDFAAGFIESEVEEAAANATRCETKQ